MKSIAVCMVLLPCLTLSFAGAGSPFDDLQAAVSTRLGMLGGTTDPAEMKEAKALESALESIQAAILATNTIGGPDVSEIPDLMDVAGILADAAKLIEKSGTPDSGIRGNLDEIGQWMSGFYGWLRDRLLELKPGLCPIKEQPKVDKAVVKADYLDGGADTAWTDGELSMAAKTWVKAASTLAKCYGKYSK